MTIIHIDHQVIDVQVAADQAINFFMNGIANSIATRGFAEISLGEGLLGLWAPCSKDELEWTPSTVTEAMMPLETLVEAYEAKGWLTTTVDGTVTINYPKITTVVEGDSDDEDTL